MLLATPALEAPVFLSATSPESTMPKQLVLTEAARRGDFHLAGAAILLPKGPVQSVVAITYLDMAGNLQTMPAANYALDLVCEPARITPVFGQIWPIPLPQIGAISVTFDAGFGGPEQVPEGIKSWIKLRVGSLYAHREEVATLSRGRVDPLPFLDGLLDPYRMVIA